MSGRETSTRPLADTATRPAGSDAERRAANALAAEAHGRRLDVTIRSFSFWPRAGLTQALLAIVAIVGGLVATSAAAPGAALVAAATVLFVLDASGAATPLRRLLGRRVSQNVEIDEPPGDKPGTVVIVAAVDTPRPSGALRAATRVARDPWLAATLALLALLICCALRAAGLDGSALTAVQFVPTVALILLVPAFVDAEVATAAANPTTGAAGVALEVADDLAGELDHFRVRCVLTGATAPSAAGMRRWLADRRGELPRETTAVVALALEPDGPSLAFTSKEGAVVAQRTHRDLRRLAAEVGEDAGGAAVVTARRPTNASRALSRRRLPAITLVAGDAGEGAASEAGAEAPDRLRAFARELIERLDADLGPSLRD